MKKVLLILSTSFTLIVTSFANTLVSNLKDSDSIINQMGTGQYDSTNCGPACIAMIENHLEISGECVEKLREEIRNASGYVSTEEIGDYLKDNHIEYDVQFVKSEEDIIRELDKGAIILVCINATYITENMSYEAGVGHYILITGYNNQYFEVMDPMCIDIALYNKKEVMKAINARYKCEFLFYEDME